MYKEQAELPGARPSDKLREMHCLEMGLASALLPTSPRGSERHWLCKGKGLHFFVYPPSSAGERGGFNKPGGKFLSITMDSV